MISDRLQLIASSNAATDRVVAISVAVSSFKRRRRQFSDLVDSKFYL